MPRQHVRCGELQRSPLHYHYHVLQLIAWCSTSRTCSCHQAATHPGCNL